MNHKTDMQAELKRIASELRAYNPAADEYKGEHIHKVWAREIEAALASRSDAQADEIRAADPGEELQGWSVTVERNGVRLLTIEKDSVGGVENIGDFAPLVRDCAEHLLSFIGRDAQADKSGAATTPDAIRSLQRLEAACDQRAALLTPEAYLAAEKAPGMREALYELDMARREACEVLARAAAPQAEAAQGVPDDVRAAVERMCAPLHESRLSGVTAQEDAWCMKLIRDYVLGTDAAAHSPDREQVGEAYPRPATSHCQNGGDVCLAGNRDGVCCPEDSCDIDDGVRKSPDASASRECGERQECHHGQDNGACGWCYDEAARGEQMAMNREDVERQYKDGIHIGSGLPRATCPCGLCSKHRFGFNSGGGVPIAAASASTLSERSECTCGNGLGHARHCPAFDESKMRYEPFALPQPQAAEPRGLTLEQREAIKWALGVAHSGAKATPEGLLMFNRWKALCALLSKGE